MRAVAFHFAGSSGWVEDSQGSNVGRGSSPCFASATLEVLSCSCAAGGADSGEHATRVERIANKPGRTSFAAPGLTRLIEIS
jgi:hypothetical protein